MIRNEDTDGEEGKIQINIYYAIAVPLIVLITTMFNLTSLLAFTKVPAFRDKPSELLILNLCCSDLITVLGFLAPACPLYITSEYWRIREACCWAVVVFLHVSVHGSLFALIAISFDRLLMVFVEYPTYVKWQSFRRVYITIGFTWTFSGDLGDYWAGILGLGEDYGRNSWVYRLHEVLPVATTTNSVVLDDLVRVVVLFPCDDCVQLQHRLPVAA